MYKKYFDGAPVAKSEGNEIKNKLVFYYYIRKGDEFFMNFLNNLFCS